MITIRKVSQEEAEGVLRFFEQNPGRKDCVVGIAGPNPTDKPTQFATWTRDDIPRLTKMVEGYRDGTHQDEETGDKPKT